MWIQCEFFSFQETDDHLNSEGNPITFELIERGTLKDEDILLDSEGFSYTRMKTARMTMPDYSVHIWTCSVRRENLMCYARIKQFSDKYFFLHSLHNHGVKKGDKLRIKLRRRVSMCIYTWTLTFFYNGMNEFVKKNC